MHKKSIALSIFIILILSGCEKSTTSDSADVALDTDGSNAKVEHQVVQQPKSSPKSDSTPNSNLQESDSKLQAGSYSADEKKMIVVDSINRVSWQDNADASSATMSWSKARDYCLDLYFADYLDWRLPTIDELSLISSVKDFKNISSGKYWSNTPSSENRDLAWAIDLSTEERVEVEKSEANYVRCIR